METVIWFFKDQQGKIAVQDCIQELIRQSEYNDDLEHLVALILKGLQFLRTYGIPYAIHEFFSTLRDDGSIYSIRIVKELKYHPPLLEFRVNWRGAGAFRAVFFEYRLEDTQLLVFTQALVKNQTHSLDFERIVAISRAQYRSFINSPEKYMS
ncbi:hypothetical protein QCD85_06030 [Paenibacillus sp. PsM32]|uniref:hypothetical protein n=1 Tax=unclassified Paenibacillus TaxID=185978 RepID=UPI00236634CB|nr:MULTISPECIES: hypothetical protein [unclassified Paenibacillus]MDN4617648.1 hypothetical protein [Paenibacillus sp. PsM32]WDF52896.1 hypothetical protein PQ460_10920 [Paenibacillus sp. KACC 21273]